MFYVSFLKCRLDKADINSMISVFAAEQRKICDDICYSTIFFNKIQFRMAIAYRYFGAFYRGSFFNSNVGNPTQSVIMHQNDKHSNKIKK